MKSRSSHRFARRFSTLGQLSLGIALILPVSPAFGEETAPPSLREAFSLLNSHHFDAAKQAFGELEAHPLLGPWAKVGKALANEQLGMTAEALKSLEDLGSMDAASLDAKVLRLRLQTKGSTEDERSELKAQLRRAGREDLLTAVLLTETELLLDASPEKAFLKYKELRPRLFLHQALPLGTPDNKSERIFSKLLQTLSPETQLKARMFEVEQLLSEKQFQTAASLAENIPLSAWKSGDGTLLRAKLLKSQGKSDEALQFLKTSSESGIGSSSETILFELTKSAWNANEPALSRQAGEKFLAAFPNSPSAPEVRYIHARTWIDEGKWNEGLKELNTLSDKRTPSEHQGLAQRELAWLAFRKEDYPQAASWFAEYRATSAHRLSNAKQESAGNEKNKKRRDASFELEHSTYWLAEVCSRIPAIRRGQACSNAPESLWKRLLADSPISYYSLLASEKLHLPFPSDSLKRAWTESSLQPSADCRSVLKEDMTRRLEKLQAEELFPLVKFEIQWSLLQSSGFNSDTSCRIHLSTLFGDSSTALRLAEEQIRGLESPQMQTLLPPLLRASYPLAYRTIFAKEALDQQVPLEFSLSIARTESYFDPSARSSSDARGLMQLLPKTAAMEGLGDPDRLFDAGTNIHYGTQHLKRLLAIFHGNQDFAAGAYNGGREAVLRWQQRSTPLRKSSKADLARLGIDAWIELIPYGETRNYIKKVRLARRWYTLAMMR